MRSASSITSGGCQNAGSSKIDGTTRRMTLRAKRLNPLPVSSCRRFLRSCLWGGVSVRTSASCRNRCLIVAPNEGRGAGWPVVFSFPPLSRSSRPVWRMGGVLRASSVLARLRSVRVPPAVARPPVVLPAAAPVRFSLWRWNGQAGP